MTYGRVSIQGKTSLFCFSLLAYSWTCLVSNCNCSFMFTALQGKLNMFASNSALLQLDFKVQGLCLNNYRLPN